MNLVFQFKLRNWIVCLLILFFSSCSLPKKTITPTTDLTFKPENFQIKITTTKEELDEQSNRSIYFDFEVKNITLRDFDSRQFQNSEIYLRVTVIATDNEAFSFEKDLGWYDYVIPAGTLKTYSFEKNGPNVINIGKRKFKSISIVLLRKYN